ncbi:mast cell protease 2-like [Atheta coriaria]|uniref:mast cell protease 2-like n=1 Tax=Dalotia coriaria TaxID=877792 RepID=UPI0031F3B698
MQIYSIHVDVILGATHLYDDQDYKLVTKFEKVVYEFQHDIVLGKLVAPVEFNQYIAPIKLPRSTDYLEGGASVWFSGWGYVSDHAEYVNELRFLELTTLDQEQCSPIPNYYVCTDGNDGKCPSLGGDEGGALVQIVDGEWTHMGVMRSTQYDDCSRGGPTRYTRTPPMVDFIYATVGPINNSN